MKPRLLLLSCLVAVAAGCGNGGVRYAPPVFDSIMNVEFETVGSELEVATVNNLFIYKSHYIILGRNKKNNTNLHIYDSEGNHVLDAIKVGRGPDEAVYCGTASLSGDSGKLVILDVITGRRLDVDLNVLLAGGDAVTTSESGSRSDASRYTSDGRLLYVEAPLPSDEATWNKPRIILRRGSDTLNCVYGFPFKHDIWKEFHLYGAGAKLELSPDESKFALMPFTTWAGILETFDIMDGEIRPRAVGNFFAPEYLLADGEIRPSPKSVLTFSDLHVTEDRIYAVYDGVHGFDSDPGSCLTDVAVFDWGCNPVMLYRTNRRIEQLAVEGEWLYAAVQDDMGCKFLSRFKL